jgi:hypothetical protein
MPKKKNNGAADAQPVSKSDFIRSLPADMPAAEVMAKAQEAGITVSKNLVYLVRSKTKAGKKPAKGKVGRPKGSRNRAAVAPTGSKGAFEVQFANLVAEIGLVRAEEMLRGVRAQFVSAR